MTPFPSPPSQTTRASFPACRFPEDCSLALGPREDLYISWPLTPPPSRNSPPATLCPADDLLVLPGGTRLPRLIWWLCHHLARARKVIPRYVIVVRASSPERPDSSLERPRWSLVTFKECTSPQFMPVQNVSSVSSLLPMGTHIHPIRIQVQAV